MTTKTETETDLGRQEFINHLSQTVRKAFTHIDDMVKETIIASDDSVKDKLVDNPRLAAIVLASITDRIEDYVHVIWEEATQHPAVRAYYESDINVPAANVLNHALYDMAAVANMLHNIHKAIFGAYAGLSDTPFHEIEADLSKLTMKVLDDFDEKILAAREADKSAGYDEALVTQRAEEEARKATMN